MDRQSKITVEELAKRYLSVEEDQSLAEAELTIRKADAEFVLDHLHIRLSIDGTSVALLLSRIATVIIIVIFLYVTLRN